MTSSENLNQTLIIAEAGVNHNGDMDMAKRMIEVAAEAGADYVKFQTFLASELVTGDAPTADYQFRNTEGQRDQRSMLAKLEIARDSYDGLIAHSNAHGIKFFSTPFEEQSLRFLVEIGMELIKVPSGEITNFPYLKHVATSGKPIIMSTGMATLGEIEAALQLLYNHGMDSEDITVLHCTTEYPAPFEEVNLRAMQTISQAFGVRVGYSDHTNGLEIPVAAVAMGARVIEKHFTLDRTLPGPDHKASMEPNELKEMVQSIRNVEKAIGDGVKRPTRSEIGNIKVARKSIVASRFINKGEIFSEKNLTTKRPGNGICASRISELIGRASPSDFDKDQLIEF